MSDYSDVTDDDIRKFARAFKGPSTQERPFALPLTENEIQRAVFSHLKTRGAENSFAFHPRNSGRDQADRRRAINAGLGVVSGVPDVVVITPRQTYALELKTEKGKLSEKQKETLVRLGHCGAITGVAFGLNEALAWLEGHGILK